MLLLSAVVAVCAARNAVVSAVAPPPLPPKIYYPLENAESYFQEHIKLHQRKYDAAEYIKRFEIFKSNLCKINALNSMYPRTVFGLTHFADLTNEEQHRFHGLRRYNNIMDNKVNKVEPFVGTTDVPDSFDWRDHGAVTPVKDMGMCIVDDIFSAIGNIEGQHAIKYNASISLSEQLELDCFDHKCDGRRNLTDDIWLPHDVMQNLSTSHGCMKEEDYPFTGMDEEQQCKLKDDKVVAKVNGFELVNIKDEATLKQQLYKIGPLSIILDAVDLFAYTGGILHPFMCHSSHMYAALLVGYGEEHGEKYWIIKYPFGVGAFENGYVRLVRGVDACGVESRYHATAHVSR